MDTEWDIAKKMAKVDPTQSIFLYPISKCTTTYKDVKKDAESSKCSYVTKVPHRSKTSKTFPMVNMVKGGMTLEDFVRKNHVSPSQFLNAILPVIKGLTMLKRQNLVHHDLKFDNILHDPATGGTKIIDFGLLIPLKGAYNEVDNGFLYSNYWLHPPEYRVFQYINEHSQSQVSATTKDAARKAAADNVKILNINFETGDQYTLKEVITTQCFRYYCEYEEAFMKYMLAVCKRASKADSISYMTKQASKIDIYSLGITMTYLSMFLNYKSDAQKKQFMEIIKQFIHPDPRKRPTPAKAIAIIENTKM